MTTGYLSDKSLNVRVLALLRFPGCRIFAKRLMFLAVANKQYFGETSGRIIMQHRAFAIELSVPSLIELLQRPASI